MRILFAASEAVPFIKTGGLADVVGTLPKFIHSHEAEVIVVLPKYRSIATHFVEAMQFIRWFHIAFGNEQEYVGVFRYEFQGRTIYFLDNEKFFGREELYGYEDDTMRFAYFNLAVIAMIQQMDMDVDVIHCHDWHTAMIPAIIAERYSMDSHFRGVKCVLTVHNPAYQGYGPRSMLSDIFQISDETYLSGKNRFGDGISFLKSGLIYSDKITTVSPTHAEELLTHEIAHGLEGVFQLRHSDLVGILNGIDYQIYNPANDPALVKPLFGYGKNRAENKAVLQQMFHLTIDPDIPLIGMVTRLVDQKGIALVLDAFESIIQLPAQVIILGSGDPKYEQQLREMQFSYTNQVGVYIGYNDRIARQIYGGSDLFLMPSLFEPCGISQMIAMHYGSIPIVHQTGGLYDTIEPYNEYIDSGNGFGFLRYRVEDMLSIIRYAISFYQNKKIWRKLVKRAMAVSFDWGQSALNYLELYNKIVGKHHND